MHLSAERLRTENIAITGMVFDGSGHAGRPVKRSNRLLRRVLVSSGGAANERETSGGRLKRRCMERLWMTVGARWETSSARGARQGLRVSASSPPEFGRSSAQAAGRSYFPEPWPGCSILAMRGPNHSDIPVKNEWYAQNGMDSTWTHAGT